MAEKKKAEAKVAETVNVIDKKAAALKEYMEKANVNGIQFVDINEHNKAVRSHLLVEGQALPMFIVVNDTVYSFIQVHLATVDAAKAQKCLPYLNELNERFNMLKYCINKAGNLVLTCSVPSGDDKFDPALLIALVDQVKGHLDAMYPSIMQKIWQD